MNALVWVLFVLAAVALALGVAYLITGDPYDWMLDAGTLVWALVCVGTIVWCLVSLAS